MRTATRWGGVIIVACGVWTPPLAAAYPNGTTEYVTDAGPFCAGCHSSRQESQLREVAKQEAAHELVDAKHVAMIASGKGKYATLSAPDRTALVAHVRGRVLDGLRGPKLAAELRTQARRAFARLERGLGDYGVKKRTR